MEKSQGTTYWLWNLEQRNEMVAHLKLLHVLSLGCVV